MGSSVNIPAMKPCPKCDRTGTEERDGHWYDCSLCNGDRYVSHFKLVQWEFEQGKEP